MFDNNNLLVMKRFFKIAFMSLAVLVGMIAGEQRARAQFVVSDPQNLVQSILQYIMDQLREGNLSLDGVGGLSKLEGMREQFKAASEKLDQVNQIVQIYGNLRGAANDIQAVVRIGQQLCYDVQMFRTIEYQLSQGVDSYFAVASVGNLVLGFEDAANELIQQTKTEMFNMQKLTQSSPMEMLSQLRLAVERLYQSYSVVRNYFAGAYYSAYYGALRNRTMSLDQRLINMMIY